MGSIISIERPLSTSDAKKAIKTFVESGKIIWTKHAKERMQEREITIPQIIHCLQNGTITEPPCFSNREGGGYEMRVEGNVCGEKLAVVICLRLSQNLLVITAF